MLLSVGWDGLAYLAIVGRYMFAEERESHVENHVSWLRMDNGRVYNARPGEEGATRVENGWDWLGGDVSVFPGQPVRNLC